MLKSLNFHEIKSDLLLTFGNRINGVFTDFDSSKDTYALNSFIAKLLATCTEYGKAYEREAKNPYTVKISNANELRGSAFYYFRNFVESSLYSEDSAEKDTAKRLVEVIQKHGWQAASFANKAQSSAFIKMITEIKDYYMPDVEALNAKGRYDKWVTRANDFETIQKASDTRPPSGLPTLGDARPKLEGAIRTLINMVDSHHSANSTDEQLAGYIDSINNIITEAMTEARAAATRDENKKKDSGTGDKPAA